MKYGFVYIWYDRKRKMFYIGCHWGTEDDGYICSSNRMRDAYRRRPQDFKRRILKRVDDRTSLLEREHDWLKLISESELGTKYYNLSKKHYGHWSHTDSSNIIRNKLSTSLKTSILNGKRARINAGSFKKGCVPWNKGMKLGPLDDKTKKKIGIGNKKRKGPYKGRQEYSVTQQKVIDNIPPCRSGKGGKRKSVIINNIVYESCTEASIEMKRSINTITNWIKQGKAKVGGK
jgi:hypothetical protein